MADKIDQIKLRTDFGTWMQHRTPPRGVLRDSQYGGFDPKIVVEGCNPVEAVWMATQLGLDRLAIRDLRDLASCLGRKALDKLVHNANHDYLDNPNPQTFAEMVRVTSTVRAVQDDKIDLPDEFAARIAWNAYLVHLNDKRFLKNLRHAMRPLCEKLYGALMSELTGIKPKFEEGQTVWTIMDNKVVETKIAGLKFLDTGEWLYDAQSSSGWYNASFFGATFEEMIDVRMKTVREMLKPHGHTVQLIKF